MSLVQAREAADRTDGALKTVKAESWPGLLELHRRWLESGGGEGVRLDLGGHDLTRAELDGANLQGARLVRTRLRGASLRRAKLEDADLDGANLQAADLTGADLRKTNLRHTTLRDAILSHADMTGAQGLLAGQLGGANLSSCQLPAGLSPTEGLANVAEASKTTQNLFFSILFVCAYTWLTIASTRDAQLLNNAAPPASRLPILGTDIPLVQFYLVAPLLLLCLFIYFHLCLQRLWEELGDLPAVFPDGRPLDKKAYPWLLNAVVRTHAPRLKEHCTHLARWQARVSILLAWGLVPMTIGVLWARYLRAHDWWVTTAQILVLSVAFGAGQGFLRLAAAALRGSERKKFQWSRAWTDARARALGAGLLAATILLVLSFGAIEGVNPIIEDRGVVVSAGMLERTIDPRHWVPRLLGLVGLNPFAQLDDNVLSTKPANWSGGEKPGEIESVRGADLEGRNLRYALAYNAFLVNGYLKKADARGGDLRYSDLRKIDFREAKLQGTNFRFANMQEADLRWADLTGAKLADTNLTKAVFDEAILQNARLDRADLTETDFTDANLRGADMTEATLKGTILNGADLTDAKGLTREQILEAKIDSKTQLPEALRLNERGPTASDPNAEPATSPGESTP